MGGKLCSLILLSFPEADSCKTGQELQLEGASCPLGPPAQILHADLKGNSLMGAGQSLPYGSLASQAISPLCLFKD